MDCFACVQAEVPPQDDASCWVDGAAQGFGHYLPTIRTLEIETGARASVKYLHYPIAEGMAPTDVLGEAERSGPLLALLDQMLLHYEGGGRAIYLHSWAGCGRAGLVGASLLSLLRPDLEVTALLEWVQELWQKQGGSGDRGLSYASSAELSGLL